MEVASTEDVVVEAAAEVATSAMGETALVAATLLLDATGDEAADLVEAAAEVREKTDEESLLEPLANAVECVASPQNVMRRST